MLKHYLIVFFVSMVPIIELRGAIPYGVGFGLPLWLTYCIAIVGNMLPVPMIYLFARKVLVWGSDKPVIGKFFTFCLEKGEKAGRKLQQKAGRGFAAVARAGGLRQMRAGIPGVRSRAQRSQPGIDPALQGVQLRRAEHAPRDARLVAGDHQQPTGGLETGQGLGHAGQPAPVFHAVHVARIQIEGAVTVQEDRATQCGAHAPMLPARRGRVKPAGKAGSTCSRDGCTPHR